MNKQIEEMVKDISSYIHKKPKRTMLIITDSKTSVHRPGLSEHLYNAGYRKQEWISVEDRLPQENEKVLAINSDGEIFIATYLLHKITPSARGYTTWASGQWNGTPTHWQPLPQPPKMKGAE